MVAPPDFAIFVSALPEVGPDDFTLATAIFNVALRLHFRFPPELSIARYFITGSGFSCSDFTSRNRMRQRDRSNRSRGCDRAGMLERTITIDSSPAPTPMAAAVAFARDILPCSSPFSQPSKN